MLFDRTLLSRYQIIERINKGGFGETYLAVDRALPSQPRCIVKHLQPRDPNPAVFAIAKQLFDREAKILDRLSEFDGIPRLYAYFEEEGQFYLVQEYIDGQELSEEFQPDIQWNERETFKLVREILEILTVVHQKKVIHRDIKPSNIMRRKQDGKLVLIDFGSVKETMTVNKHGITDSTIAIGTPIYMPVEQCSGNPRLASDIYALGMLAIEALTGVKPDELPRDPHTLNPIWRDRVQVSDSFAKVLNNMVRYDFKRRYPNAAEALKALITTEVISPSQPKKWRWWFLLGTVLSIGAGIAAIALINQPNYSRLEKYLASEQWKQADLETDQILLKSAGKLNSLDSDSIEHLSCQILSDLDRLWFSYSKGRFGFRIQKQLYLATGNHLDRYTETTYRRFGARLDWRVFSAWKYYSELTFSDLAPQGHLPSPGTISQERKALRFQERWMLLSRVDACGL
jgi:serine/threonine-protein kinase